MSKTAKRVLVVVALLLVLVLGAGLLVGNYFFNLALTPGSDKSMVLGAPHNAVGGGEENPAVALRRQQQEAWAAAVTPVDRALDSFDGLRLRAVEVQNPEGGPRWAILCHGYMNDASGVMSPGRRFYEMGFNLLMPDARGHGESEGDYIGMGWHERLDLLGWIEQILGREPEAEIVLYGISMGAATVMMTSGEPLPANVKVIVEDCGYTSVWDEFSHQLKGIFGLPDFPVLHFASLVTRMRAGYWLGEASAIDQVAKSTTPTLFIHGEADTFVPYAMLDEVYEAATCPKERLSVPGAGHGSAQTVLGDAYWATVGDFVGRYIPLPEAAQPQPLPAAA